MEWYNIIGYILGGSGAIGGVYTLYTMAVKKDSLAIQNLKEAIEILRVEREKDKAIADAKFKLLNDKIDSLENKNELQIRVINQSYKCKLADAANQCPVVDMYDEILKSK